MRTLDVSYVIWVLSLLVVPKVGMACHQHWYQAAQGQLQGQLVVWNGLGIAQWSHKRWREGQDSYIGLSYWSLHVVDASGHIFPQNIHTVV